MDPFYTDEQRALQDAHGSRALADRLEQVIIRPEIDDETKAFIESRDLFFLSTVDRRGQPTVSHKGGAPGFVRVTGPSTLVFPSYDGNGMYLSMGNLAATGRIGMLFMDFEHPHRVRIQAQAALTQAPEVMTLFPGADMVVEATLSEVFVNCPRYIHCHRRVEASPYVPDAAGEAPLPPWKRIDILEDVIAREDAARIDKAGGSLTIDEYGAGMKAGEL